MLGELYCLVCVRVCVSAFVLLFVRVWVRLLFLAVLSFLVLTLMCLLVLFRVSVCSFVFFVCVFFVASVCSLVIFVFILFSSSSSHVFVCSFVRAFVGRVHLFGLRETASAIYVNGRVPLPSCVQAVC